MTEKDQDAVLTEVRDGVGIATLNRPDKFNCVSTDLVQGLDAALTQFEQNPDVRVLLINGNGAQFCTGADLDEVLNARKSTPDLDRFMRRGHIVLRRLEASRLPVVAAVHGLALAGGLEIVLTADIVLAHPEARFGDQHAQYGLAPGWGGTQRLARIVGLRRALELMYSGRWLDVEEAHSWGLINAIVPADDFLEGCLDYCRPFVAGNPNGLALMKKLARDGLDTTLDTGLAWEQEAIVPFLQSDNVSEGLDAFQNRRKPDFK